MTQLLRAPLCAMVLFGALGCIGTDEAKSTDTSGEDSDSGADVVDAVCTEPTEVACTDYLIEDLSLHDEVSEGAVVTTTEGDDFVTTIDASAGGYTKASQNPWVYIKFTSTGAEKVEITDEDALESMDWDLSARRFILRLNGGDSGPSCVGAATLLESAYEDVTTVPDGISYVPDDYYTDDCTIVNDSSGLEGSPQVALGAYWSYSACVAMTYVPFLIQLADGHVIKLRVETYYKADQDICDTDDTVPSDGGYITLRWRMLL